MNDSKSDDTRNGAASPGPNPKSLGLGVALGAAGATALAAVVGLGLVYTGAYNVAATEEHTSLGHWALDTSFRNSVKARADGLTPPEITPQMLEAGAASYKAMCAHCHGGPGVERADWAGGMRPRPPHLAEAAAHWETRDVFWIAKHGVKMTGMPAFGATHDDEALWSVAAFVKALPGMTPDRYGALGAQAGHHGDGEGQRP
jgi:mono/diheme cytochrome c family protein